MSEVSERTYFEIGNGVAEVRGAVAAEAAAWPTMRVDARTVDIAGSCFVYGNDITFVVKGQQWQLGTLLEWLPRWYHIKVKAGMQYSLKFGASGALALQESGLASTAAPQASEGIVMVSSSLPVSISNVSSGGAAAALGAYKVYPKAGSVMGLPGAAIASAQKSGLLQGSAGYNSLIAGGSSVGVYLVCRYKAPIGVINVSPILSPVYFAVLASNLPRIGGTSPSGLKFGDVSLFAPSSGSEITVGFAIPYSVSDIGFWMPAAEVLSGGTEAYCSLSVNAYSLVEQKELPMGGVILGGAGGVGAGSMAGSATGSAAGTLGGSGAAV